MTDHAHELRRYARKIAHPAGDVPAVMLAAADEIERLAARLEAAEKEHAKRVFGGDYSTIQWLDPWCRIPSSWHAADEDGLKAELKEAQIGRTETEAKP